MQNQQEISSFQVPLMIDLSIKKQMSFIFDEREDPPSASCFVSLTDLPKIIKIQTFFKMSRCFRAFKIRQKRFKHRKFVLDELRKTERDYHNNLQIIIDFVMKPVNALKIVSKDESDLIFSNIESICLLSNEFLNVLDEKLEKYDRNSLVIDKLLPILPHYKLYFIYCKNYNDFLALFSKFTKLKHPFLTFLDKIEHTNVLNNLDFCSQMIKPIQRLPKYILLFKDLLKNTEKNHADYVNIQQILQKFIETNENNNESMQDYLKQMKMRELQEVFGNPNNLTILNGKREFIQEEALNYVENGIPKPAIAYFLSDSFIIAKRDKENFILNSFFELDSHGFIKNMPNLTYFKHIFAVYGRNGCITLSTDSEKTKTNLMELIEEKIIRRLKLKFEINAKIMKSFKKVSTNELAMDALLTQIRVNVVGTVSRGFKESYNSYVIEILFNNFAQTIYFRYSELLKLSDMFRKIYNNATFSLLARDFWSNSTKARTIETRKILIENFLQSVLTNKIIMKDKEKILKYLSLPPNLEVSKLEQPYLSAEHIAGSTKHFGLFSVFAIMFEIYKEKKLISQKPIKDDNSFEIIIKLTNRQLINILINRNTKAIELILIIAKNLQIKSFLDFKLFVVNNLNEERPLEDDELVVKVLEMEGFVEDIEATPTPSKISDFFSKIKHNLGIKSKTSPFFNDFHLIFKKYVYLAPEIESKDLSKDAVRLELVASQVFSDAFSANFVLSLDDYSLLVAFKLYLSDKMEYYIKLGDKFEKNDVITDQIVKDIKLILPIQVFIRRKEGQWIKSILDLIQKIEAEIQSILKINQKECSSPTSSQSIDPKILTYLTIMEFIVKNEFYGTKSFWVNLNIRYIDEKAKKMPELPEYLWFVVKYDCISMLNTNKKKIWTSKLEKINEFCSLPLCLTIEVEGCEIKLESADAFEIFQLLSIYVKIRRLMPRWRRKSFAAAKNGNKFD